MRLNKTLAVVAEQEKNSALPFGSAVLLAIASLMQSLTPDKVIACGLIWAEAEVATIKTKQAGAASRVIDIFKNWRME